MKSDLKFQERKEYVYLIGVLLSSVVEFFHQFYRTVTNGEIENPEIHRKMKRELTYAMGNIKKIEKILETQIST